LSLKDISLLSSKYKKYFNNNDFKGHQVTWLVKIPMCPNLAMALRGNVLLIGHTESEAACEITSQQLGK
jgi:hypothetical protein